MNTILKIITCLVCLALNGFYAAAAEGSASVPPAVVAPAPTFLPSDEAWRNLPPHPRLFANAARIEALKAQSDEVSRQLLELLNYETEKKLTLGPIDYPATGFLMSQMRNVQGRILGLALSYRLTGDKRFFVRARDELLRLADLPEWRPSHFLDVGEAALAAGVGYDWLHDGLTPTERERVAAAIVRNAILPSLEVQDVPHSWLRGDFNWTQVCHGGVVVAALAIAEREPSLARQVTERAIVNFDRVGATYGPDGIYAEGGGYWAYGTGFHVILIEALRTALGTSCGLEKFPGFLKTGEFATQLLAPTGTDFNYSDHSEGVASNDPVMIWFARENRDRSLARGKLAVFARNHALALGGADPGSGPKYSGSRHFPFEVLWWDPSLPAGSDTRARHWTADGVLPLAVLRSAWDDPAAAYIAIKGGTSNHSHAHMDAGGFILETDGVRWAVESGTQDYGTMRKGGFNLWDYSQDSARWSTFRVGPDGHNILRFDGARQNVDGKGTIRALPAADDGTIGNVVELSSIYAGQVARVTRTVRLQPNRTICITDDWTALAGRPVTASAQWLTRSEVTRTPGGLRLSQSGKTLEIEVRAELAGSSVSDLVIVVEDVSAARAAHDSPNPGLTRILFNLPTPAGTAATLHLRVRTLPLIVKNEHLHRDHSP